MRLAIPLSANITVLDAVGPYEILSRVPGVEVIFVGAAARPYASDSGMLRIHADATIDDVSSRSGRLARGLTATTHWMSLERLREHGATPTTERVVGQGRVITAAGVSSGLDMALTLAARIAGPDVAQAIQLSVEYDPQPPFDAGSPEKAPTIAIELARAAVARREERASARATDAEVVSAPVALAS